MLAAMLAILLCLALVTDESAPLRDVRAALARPPSPGGVAMLVGKLAEDGVAARLAEALRHESASVRATAARVIAVSGGLGLRDEVVAQLDREADVSVAAELLRTALLLGSPPDDAVVRGAVRRYAGNLDLTLAETLARTQGVTAILRPGLLEGLAIEPRAWRLLRIALRGDAQQAARALEALADEGDAGTFGRVLAAAREEGLELDTGALLSAARASSAPVRAQAYLDLAATGGLPSDLAERLASVPEATASEAGSDAGFAHDLLQRRLGRAPRPDAAWQERARSGAALDLNRSTLLRSDILRLMTRDERRALAARTDLGLRVTDKGRELSREEALEFKAATPPSPIVRRAPSLRLASGLPSGLLTDLVRLAECRPKATSIAHAQVRFRPDGRPAQVGMLDSKLSEACDAVARAALPLVLAPDSVRPDLAEVLALPLDDDESSCDERPLAAVPVPLGPGAGGILAPRKVRDVKPEFPAVAVLSGLRGIVVLQALVSEAGCVREVSLLKGAHPSLDGAAIRAVSRWRYTPTLLDGKPVPVTMTVTVNFQGSSSPLGPRS
jgi:TonB family protein